MKLNYKYFALVVAPMISLGLFGVFNMIANAEYAWLALTFVFWILLSGLGIAVGFHRIYSHRTYELKPWLDNIILACGTLACQSSSLTWVATHIGYHHPHSDTEKDPHTPTKGILYAFLGWTFFVNAQTINHKYAVKLMRNKAHMFAHKHYHKLVWGFVLAFLIVFGWKALIYGYCIAAMISILTDNLVNVLGHSPKLGYRNFDTKDNSSNFLPLGYLGWGQGWHNNHHQFPARFDFGIKSWEWDPCKIFIPLLKMGSTKSSE
jgi:stearoyl-CoA desaturase (delta-9 desaturase)